MSKIDITQAAWIPLAIFIPMITITNFYLKASSKEKIFNKDFKRTYDSLRKDDNKYLVMAIVIFLVFYFALIISILEYNQGWLGQGEEDQVGFNYKIWANAMAMVTIIILPVGTVLGKIVNSNQSTSKAFYNSFLLLIVALFIILIAGFIDFSTDNPFPIETNSIAHSSHPGDTNYLWPYDENVKIGVASALVFLIILSMVWNYINYKL